MLVRLWKVKCESSVQDLGESRLWWLVYGWLTARKEENKKYTYKINIHSVLFLSNGCIHITVRYKVIIVRYKVIILRYKLAILQVYITQFWLYTWKWMWKWRDIQPSMVTHTRNSCSAFTHPKCTHPAVNTHTPWTHTRSSGQPFMLRCLGGSWGFGALHKGTSSWYWRWREHCTFTPPTDSIASLYCLNCQNCEKKSHNR